MKKIIAILTALAVVSMAFAQTVSIKNTLSTKPVVTIDGAYNQWKFNEGGTGTFLREQVEGTASTADDRASVWARARLDAKVRSTDHESILNLKPQWVFVNDLSAAALIKPINGLEIKVGSADGLNKSFGPGIEWENENVGNITIPDVTGLWNGVNAMRDGIYAAFTGVDNLWVGAGLVANAKNWNDSANVWNIVSKNTAGEPDKGALIKKGAFGPFQIGASYDTDLFGVGAKYMGQFGGYNGTKGVNGEDNSNTGKFNHHNIYAGFTFKGLQDAKVGTTIGAAVDFNTNSASSVMNDVKAYTAFAVSANADMNFRNGITDKVAVTVAYATIDGNKSKVLPFHIANDLGYKVSDDASFSLHTSYTQAGLKDAMKTYDANNADVKGTEVAGAVMNGTHGSVIALKPSFNFSMGAHSFSFAVDTQVANTMKYNKKTSADWAFTSLYGKKAQVAFPISWSYQF